MDVLKPETYWIGNRCYRINPSLARQNQYVSLGDGPVDGCQQNVDIRKPYIETDEFSDPPVNMEDEIAEPAEADVINITKEENGFKVVCSFPATLFPHVIGSKGAVKKRIETETRTRIYVPRQNEKGDMVIRGQSEQDVKKAYTRVDQITSNARFKREVTHFACFHINSSSVIQKFKELREKLLQDCGMTSRGIDKNVFQMPSKLHLTICVMVLLDESERRAAADILSSMETEIRERIEGKGKLRIRLKGLEIMNDDPSQVHVLYAKCEPVDDKGENTVQNVADLISRKFVQKGLGQKSRGEKVKLHCTLINTRYRNRESNIEVEEENRKHDDFDRSKKRNGGHSTRESFDARAVLQAYGEYDFGIVEISEVKIATRYTTANDGFFKCYSTMSF